MRFLLCILLAFCSASLVHAGNEALGAARKALDSRDYAAAFEAVRPLQETDKTGEAAYILSVILDGGFGVVRPDEEQASALLQQAAGRGFPKAQAALGMAYFEGKGVPRDLAQAKSWWLKAAARNNEAAIYNLGFLAFRVNRDYKEAVTWLTRAADAGNVEALKDLAEIHERGLGVPANPSEAASFMRRAAIAGDISAMQKMVEYYVNGTGVPQDYARAEMWAQLAAKKGDGISSEGRTLLDGRLTEASRSEAARLLAQCEVKPKTGCQ